ncbi:MAG: hypothetical protein H6Q66_2490 [Firmicutes bacterium]|nr:hypothetical protein [Bacillota bacterium]
MQDFASFYRNIYVNQAIASMFCFCYSRVRETISLFPPAANEQQEERKRTVMRMINKIRKAFQKQQPKEEDLSVSVDLSAVMPETPVTECPEKEINHWLKKEISLSKLDKQQKGLLRFIRYITVELEENNLIRIRVMSRFYIPLYIDTEIVDFWHDHKTSSMVLQLKSVHLSEVTILPQFLSQRLMYIAMSLIGFFFNPMIIREGMFLRVYSDTMVIDMHEYLKTCSYPPIAKYLRDSGDQIQYNFFVIDAKTSQGNLQFDIHKISPEGREKIKKSAGTTIASQASRVFNFTDIWQLSLIAILVSFSFLLIRPYLVLEYEQVTLSWSFFSTLIIFVASLMIMNIGRWLYQLRLKLKKEHQSTEFQAAEIRYQIGRLKRDIWLEMNRIKKEHSMADDVEKQLFNASMYRRKAQYRQEKLDILHREIKLKYGLAYLVTVISELIAFKIYGVP